MLSGMILGLAIFAHSTYAFEVCTEDNSFLESLLPPASAPQTPLPAVELPSTCIEAANLSLPAQGFYGFCPSAAGRPQRTHPRPCVSERYVNAIHTALIDVTSCFGYDPNLAFATFNLESAVHLTAVGAAADVGIGQLTRSAIDEVNLNALDRARRFAESSALPACQRLVPMLATPVDSDISQRCGFMTLPANPEINVLYSILLLQQKRRSIEALWRRHGIQLPDGLDQDRFKTYMTMLSYNAGPGGITSTFKAYLDQMADQITDWHLNFENFDADSWATYLADHFPSSDEAVRRRVSRYMRHVKVAARRADRLAGGRGECLNTTYIEPSPTTTTRPLVLKPAETPNALLAEQLVCRHMREMSAGRSRQELEFLFLPKGETLASMKCLSL